MLLRLTIASVLLAALSWSWTAAGEAPARTWTPDMPPPTYTAYRAEHAIGVDGKLDESSWKKAPPLELACNLSTHAEEIRYKAVCRILWDDTCLYVGFSCPDQDGVVMPASRERRKIIAADAVEFFVDPSKDHQLFYEFHANGLGWVYNTIVFKEKNKNHSGQTGLDFMGGIHLQGVKAAGTVSRGDSSGQPKGFTVELALPLGSDGLGMFCPEVKSGAWPREGTVWRVYPVRVKRRQAKATYIVPSPTFQAWNHVPERWVPLVFSEMAPKDDPDHE